MRQSDSILPGFTIKTAILKSDLGKAPELLGA